MTDSIARTARGGPAGTTGEPLPFTAATWAALVSACLGWMFDSMDRWA